ncbi:tetratricopeptide repeat protein, partial [Xylanibacter caecicola]
MKRFIILFMVSTMTLCSYAQRDKSADSEQLGKALEYFSGGKYHEALILFTQIDKRYNLNPRFKAYIGVCYYYEWDYENACKYLDTALPDIENYAPHERSVYYYCNAESHFLLEKYKEAIPLYEKLLNVCFNNEKGDALYRLGFCYMFNEDWTNARDYFSSAVAFYESFSEI